MNQFSSTKRIAFFLPALHGGGAERVAINLLKGMLPYDVSLDLVLASREGPYLEQVPSQVRVVDLAAGRVIKAIAPLSRYLRQAQPDALFSHMNHANVIAVMARELAHTNTQLVLVEHDTLSVARSNLLRGKLVPLFMKLLYPRADAIVGVSQGAARDLAEQLNIAPHKLSAIYNPVVDEELITKAKATLNHPWFQNVDVPVFLAVGRLTLQKDFSTLIQAFAIVRKTRPARLLILGEGEARQELEALTQELGIAEDVSFPGFVDNPYAYMSRAAAFVLSSRWEGLPTVLIEAMACGCPVIATNCPSGPEEILAAGKYGALVPIGDVSALSTAMLKVLNNPMNHELLVQRARDFSLQQAVPKYLELLLCKEN
ncbi:glycosyltransferase [Gloeocapsopsis dulcis]|uniref:Glycosyl transferase n=1 Tax=Gloeocapsopsis dulcis AAB1 = 1H9 TaxID=1433147 RepID=A0A6N8G281_9CHRO|nr:glycosyltransferase [Gloeocapsopsis dulcis]MUL39002.1 glycosyl transferase [Gloeocapsopsis dulcis AAB1 = 1H9]WNN90835.1 glycosyltransferase [Gloeocapsopsis dulcis]